MAYLVLLVYVAALFIRPQEWVAWMYGWRLMDVIVGAALLSYGAHLLTTDWRFLKKCPETWMMLGLYVGVLMSHVRHTYFAALIEDFQSFGKTVLIFLLVVSLVNTVKRAKGLILVMILGCLFMSAHAWLQWNRGYGFGGDFEVFRPLTTQDIVRVRALGFFHDPNDLALMLVTVLPFLFSGAISRGRALPTRVLSLAACVPMIAVIFMTNSRGGWLALGAMSMAYVWLHLRHRKIATVLAILVFIALFFLGPSRLAMVSAGEDRVALWGYGNWMLKRWPLFGAGFGRFTEFSERSMVAHNSFVHCYAELGLFGYFFWMGLVVSALKDGWALARAPQQSEAPSPDVLELARLGRASTAALVGFLSGAVFLSRSYVLPLFILTALVGTLRLAYGTVTEQDLPGRLTSENWRLVAACTLASIPALWIFIRIFNIIG